MFCHLQVIFFSFEYVAYEKMFLGSQLSYMLFMWYRSGLMPESDLLSGSPMILGVHASSI